MVQTQWIFAFGNRIECNKYLFGNLFLFFFVFLFTFFLTSRQPIFGTFFFSLNSVNNFTAISFLRLNRSSFQIKMQLKTTTTDSTQNFNNEIYKQFSLWKKKKIKEKMISFRLQTHYFLFSHNVVFRNGRRNHLTRRKKPYNITHWFMCLKTKGWKYVYTFLH